MTITKNILFDLDGTLTDSRQGILRCFQYAMDRLNIPCPDETRLEQCIGPPLAESFRQLLTTDDADRISEAVMLYRERFSEKGLYENKVYEGIPDLLAKLTDEGQTLFVATAKTEYFADIILDHFNLSTFFKGVYGAAADSSATGKTELVRDLLTRENLSAEETFMVGDRKHDITAALDNEVTATGALWGYGSAQELRIAGAQYLFGKPHEVSNLLLIL